MSSANTNPAYCPTCRWRTYRSDVTTLAFTCPTCSVSLVWGKPPRRPYPNRGVALHQLRHPVPGNLDPLIKEFLTLVSASNLSMYEMARQTGYHRNSLDNVRAGHAPSIIKVRDYLDTVGYEVKFIKKGKL